MVNVNRLVIMSNRLPVALHEEDGAWTASPAPGGLVTALTPVLKRHSGVWIGWPGTTEQVELAGALETVSAELGYRLEPVQLNAEQLQGYYYGFSNEIIWPLFHGFETRCNFEPAYWHDYQDVNRQFAAATAGVLEPGDFLWIHDYHLMLTARELKRQSPELNCAFFLHIPFPPPDIFFKLPWRKEILEGLLAFDLIGFQTLRDRRNFTLCLQQLRIPGLKVYGRGAVVDISLGEHHLRAGAFPISLDYQDIQRHAATPEVEQLAWLFHEKFPDRQIMIGMDRLDYTKGIPERLAAFGLALERYPELRGNLTMVQLTVPSRERVPEYERLRHIIEQLVGQINGQYTEVGDWVPIHYIHRSVSRSEVLAYLRAAENAIVTPLRDGMNLVAKEYVACNLDGTGALILSEFAGVAAEFKRRAILVNPYDIEGMAAAIQRVYLMDINERKRRMIKLREIVRKNDIFTWVENYVVTATHRHEKSALTVDEFAPDFKLSDTE
ncbi:trehalose-6-phosphate synthase [bacterium]|nr:trehalose-6-phosphate synthase [bacterium]